ncbi:MAG: F0F1 ATP synthase subunit alpha, partial [Actinomycetota bacterium]
QFRELEAFATFGSELDAVSKGQLERGARLVELLKQGLHELVAVEDQVISIYAGTHGHLDAIPVADVRRFETELLDYMRTRHADLVATIRDSGALPDEAALDAAVAAFAAGFVPASGTGAVAGADIGELLGEAESPETLVTE